MAQHIDAAPDDLVEDVWPLAGRAGGHDRHRGHPVALVLEDEPVISIDVEMTLSLAGFEVFSVRSCKEAEAWLNIRMPDIAIVDVELLDGKCHDVVLRLLESDVPFIVHSGDDRNIHAETPFAHGLWVGKPATSEALLEAAQAAVVSHVQSALVTSARRSLVDQY